jgi:hypothetical protein
MPQLLSQLVPTDPPPPAGVLEAQRKAVELRERAAQEREAAQ